jgi:hypothetical protein
VAVRDVRLRLQADVEQIMETPEIVKELKKFQDEFTNADEDGDFDVTSLEEEVRRIVQRMVYDGFIQEVTPVVEELMLREKRKSDPNYGWLNWQQYRLFRVGSDGTRLKGHRLRWKGPGNRWEGEVVDVGSKYWCLGLCDREITVNISGKEKTMKLSDELKAGVEVFDQAAYHRSQPGWLLWSDWAEYRVSSDSRELVGKEIRLDFNLAGCEHWKGSCPAILSDGHGVLVTDASWKLFDSDRVLEYDIGKRRGCRGTKSIKLTSEKKGCLRVNDGHAYERYIQDAPRREQETHFNNNDFSATAIIQDDLVKAMACGAQGHNSQQERAEIGNAVLRSKTGMPSVELQVESGAEADNGDEEVQNVILASEESFQAANRHRCA